MLRLADRDELRWRLLQPREQVADLAHREALEGSVRLRLSCVPLDVELVSDVAVQVNAFGPHGLDDLPRERERNRLVSQEVPAHRGGDHPPLVADDRILESPLG